LHVNANTLDCNKFLIAVTHPKGHCFIAFMSFEVPQLTISIDVDNRNFDPEYKMVAAGWSKLANKSQLFFSVLDFKAGQAVFQKFGMNSAPSALYFPASSKISSDPTEDRYDFGRR